MKNLTYRGFVASLMMGAAPVWLAGASAQEATPPAQTPQKAAPAPLSRGASDTVEEIVVTATRREQKLSDVPMSVTAVTADQVNQYQIYDFKDVQELSPGLEITNTTGRNNTATLRGIAFDPDSGTAPAVDVYFNEIPLDAQSVFTAIYDIGQFEVLNGPQGLFRGRTSPAGSITLTSQNAVIDETSGYVQGTVSDRSAHNLQGAINVPLIDDRLALRLAALDDENELNDVHDVTNGARSHSETKSTRTSLAFNPTSDLSFNFMWQYLYANNNQLWQVSGPGALLPSAPITSGHATLVPNGPSATAADRIAVEDGPNRVKNRDNIFTLSGDWRLDGATISLVAGHQNDRLLSAIDLDRGNAIPNYDELQTVDSNYEVEYAELRAASTGNGFWNYMGGLSYFREVTPTFDAQPNPEFVTGIPGLSFFPNYALIPVNVSIGVPGQNTTYSAFFANTLQLTDRLKAEFGARYSFYRVHQQSFLSVNAEGSQVLSDFGTISPNFSLRNYEAVTGGADLTYAITPDVNGYVSYGHSFRPGSAAVGVTAPLANDLIVTNPETSDSFEIGTKSRLFDDKVTVNADAFYQHFNGYLSRTLASINASSAGNGVVDSTLPLNFNGNAVSTGFEAQVQARVLPRWNVGYNMSWIDAQFKNAKEPCNAYTSDGSPYIPVGQQALFCTTNGRVADTAKFHMTLTSDYTFPIDEPFTPFVRGVFTYAPGFHSSVLDYNYEDQPMLNLFAGIRSPDEHWELTIFAKNALNIDRITSISQGNYLQATSALNASGSLVSAKALNSGYMLVTTTPPTEVGISLRYDF